MSRTWLILRKPVGTSGETLRSVASKPYRPHCDGPSALTNPTADCFRGKAQLRGKSKLLHRFYSEKGQSELDTLQIHRHWRVVPHGASTERNTAGTGVQRSKRTPLTALGRRVAPVKLTRSSSRFRKPHDASRDARANNSGDAAAASTARRSPLHKRFCGT